MPISPKKVRHEFHYISKLIIICYLYPLITFWLECVAIENFHSAVVLGKESCLKNKRANVGENV